MSRFVNLAIDLGALTIFLSLIDLLLRPDQRKRIENVIDSITLRLDYTKTIDWLQRWLQTSRRAEIAGAVLALITALGAVAIVALGIILLCLAGIHGALRETFWEILVATFAAFCLWLFQWWVVSRVYERIGRPILKGLADAESYSDLVVGYLFVTFGGAICIGLCLLFFYWVFGSALEFEKLSFLGKISANWIFGLTVTWLLLIVDGIVTLFVAPLIFVARLAVDSARWLMWRISQYPRGPLAATLIVVSAILAALKLVVLK
jgi:hypothetical protein